MARIKLVLWERRKAWLQAQAIFQQESRSPNANPSSDSSTNTQQIVAANDNDQSLEADVEIALLGRNKSAFAASKMKMGRIRIKKASRPTSWKVV